MTEAYRSALDISFDVKAGLLIRQTHHWAADVFLVAIVLHLLRVFFTGAYRKPRELTYLIGVTMLALALLEGYLGYSLVDDLLSGMGLAIGYSVLVSVPLVGANLALLVWGGAVPRRHGRSGRGCTSRTCCCCRSRSRRCSRCTCCSSRRATTRSSRGPRRTKRRARRDADVPRATRRARSGCCSPSPRCSCCSAASRRSTRSGCGARTTSTPGRTARSPTGTSAG